MAASLCVISGGAFSSIYFSGTSHDTSVLNAIPTAPSPVPYGVPQVLQGLWVLHQKYGDTPWADLVRPAVILADEGFLVDSILHAALLANHDKVVSSEGLCGLFCDPHRSLKNIGDRVTNPALGRLLEQVAGSVSDSGLLGDLIDRLMTDLGVTERETFTMFLSRLPALEEPLTLHLDTLTLFTTGAPTAGKILSNVIQKVYGDKPREGSVSERLSVSARLLNASQMMYALGGAWPRELSSSFSPLQLPPWNPAPVGTNVVIADSYGDLFVLSLTLNGTFGSGFVSPSTGILLSDCVQGPGPAQSPLYWACPSVLTYGADNDVMAVSAYGGSSVPFSEAQVVISRLLLEMDLPESVAGSLVEVPPKSSDPWMGYFGLKANGTEPVVAVEVEAEHVHVVRSHGPCCSPSGL